MSGCVLKPRYDFDTMDKALLATAIGAQMADYWTTHEVLDDGGYETNPLIGSHPSDGKLMAFKAVGIGLTCWLAKVLKPKARKWVLGGLSAFYGGVVMNNMRLK